MRKGTTFNLTCNKIRDMNKAILLFCFIGLQGVSAQVKDFITINSDSSVITLTVEGAAHLAAMPLKCLQQEYPNKTGHTAVSDIDQLLTPKQLHPVFIV